MQRVEQPIMTTGLERIAAKAREDRKLKFTSLAHHVTEELIWESVCHIPNDSAPGCDGQTVEEAKESFKQWAPEMLRAIHDRGYRPPPILRVFIPKPGKKEKRPLGIPCVTDRALQRSVAGVLAAIYEQDFLSCSFGGKATSSIFLAREFGIEAWAADVATSPTENYKRAAEQGCEASVFPLRVDAR